MLESQESPELAAFLTLAKSGESPLPGEVVFAKVAGSRSHNLNKPDSDWDWFGVYALPAASFLGLDFPELVWPPKEERRLPKSEQKAVRGTDKDMTFYEARQFADLLASGNPHCLEALYTERGFVSNPAWEWLRSERHRFLSRAAVRGYLGFADGQLRHYQSSGGKRGLHSTGGAYSEKWAYHLLRLLSEAVEISQGKTPLVRFETDSAWHSYLMRVRNDEIPASTVIKTAKDFSEMVHAAEPWPLPETGDRDFLNEWLIQLRRLSLPVSQPERN